MRASTAAVWGVIILALSSGAGNSAGPGLPNLPYTSAQVFRPLSIITSTDAAGNARGHAHVAMHDGYLLVPYAADSGRPGGGLSFYDIADPAVPILIHEIDVPALREAHGFGFSNSYGGKYAVFQATEGIQFWDLTTVTTPVLLNYLKLPGVSASDYDYGAWWVFWQAPYVYVAGARNGLYVVNATNPRAPVLVKQVPTTQTGGFRVSNVFAIGNLLVLAAVGSSRGIATLDISDPRNPTLIRANTAVAAVYSSQFNGNLIAGSGNDGRLYVYSVRNPTAITLVNQSPVVGAKGGYATFQGSIVHGGYSDRYGKVSISDPASYTIVGTGTSGIASRDEDFVTALGNLVFVGSDHPVGSALMPHQSARDLKPPAVNRVVPQAGATGQGLTSRVGLSFTDQIDLNTVNRSTFIVRPLGGSALRGKYSAQTNFVNFSPAQPLQPSTTYEVVVPAGGVRDYAGNATSVAFSSRFTTR